MFLRECKYTMEKMIINKINEELDLDASNDESGNGQFNECHED